MKQILIWSVSMVQSCELMSMVQSCELTAAEEGALREDPSFGNELMMLKLR
eukprot:COSAG02_NODE_3399_length_6811_cov_16.128278_6_plen_51_part_00